MSDGTRLRQTWYAALNDAETHFRRLLTSSSSPDWKRVPISDSSSTTRSKGKARVAPSSPELGDVIIHRNAGKTGDSTWRALLEVPLAMNDLPLLDGWRSVLITPELRTEWDPAVEGAHMVEVFDHATRISKTNYRLGWPANPRDAVVISRTFNDASTIIDISTSLPRSADEPTYLRPSPPYVRSHVKLFAWCIQYIQPATSTANASPVHARKNSLGARLRITSFWNHDIRTLWSLGGNAAVAQQLATMVLGLHRAVKRRGHRIPVLGGYGNGISIERIRFAGDREALTVDYAIIPDEEDNTSHAAAELQGFDELHAVREARRLTRSIECQLPSADGWDVQISTKASRPQVAQLPWHAQASRIISPSPLSLEQNENKITFAVQHSQLPDDHSILKVRITLEASASSGLRLNGIPHAVSKRDDRDPDREQYFMDSAMLADASSTTDMSFRTVSSKDTIDSSTSTATTSTISGSVSTSAPTERPELLRTTSERTAAGQKSILSRVKRNYIYFSSLLQEPEAKWKATSAARGVEVTQLDSIDPTLVVYRAEATFVGVGIWDLFAAIATPGTRAYWDKLHDDAVLLEDVNELSSLWHIKTKPAWPVQGRDVVLLTTVYKSPSALHVFSFSADDPHMFPSIPPQQIGVIRTQVDLYGFSIEALSPNTTLVTLLEQSDPKGWTNKSSIPQQMIQTLAGLGEFAIRCGGPPVLTRLAGAKATQDRYDHERSVFRLEYVASASRRALSAPTSGDSSEVKTPSAASDGKGEEQRRDQANVVECEIRADVDGWGAVLDVVVDPPPTSASALRRHRLSANGGGLWLTLVHDSLSTADERVLVLVRRGPPNSGGAPGGREKTVLMLNGARAAVDIEEMHDAEAKSLAKQKRTKPVRIPLDQPPVLGVIRRRKAEWDGEAESNTPDSTRSTAGTTKAGGRFGGPVTNFLTRAVQQATTATQQAVAAMSPPTSGGGVDFSSSKPPLQYALDALTFVQDYHANPTTAGDGWTPISDKGFPVHRKICPAISSTLPVHRGERVLECVSAEEVAAALGSYGCRRGWDDRFDGVSVLQTFGGGAHTTFVINKGGFPFRDRGFYLATLTTRTAASPSASRRNSAVGTPGLARTESRPAIFVVSASFAPDAVSDFQSAAYNAYNLPIGRVLVDAWILETLDPYGTENYAIPSTRCTRLVAVDYAGSIPAAVNALVNVALPRAILSLETYCKTMSGIPFTRMPTDMTVVADRTPEDSAAPRAWTIRRRDATRTLVDTTYTPDARTYRSLVTLAAGSSHTAPISSPSEDTSESITPRPSRLSLGTGKRRPSEIVVLPRKNTSDSSGSAPTSPRAPAPTSPRTPYSSTSATNGAARPRSHSRSLMSSMSSPPSSTFTARGEVRAPADMLVAELVLDAKLYPHGCAVTVRSRLRDSTRTFVPLAPGVDVQPVPVEERVLPITAAAYTLPSSPLHSSGLRADQSTRALLRLALPTGQFQRQPLRDPLTGEMRAPPARPAWLAGIHDRGALLDIRISPLPAPDAPSGTVRTSSDKDKGRRGAGALLILVDGEEIKVQSESEALAALGRDELTADRIAKMPMLARVDHEDVSLPAELKEPVGVAEHLLDPTSPLIARPPEVTMDTKEEPLQTASQENLASMSSGGSPAPTNTAGVSPATTFRGFWAAAPTAWTKLAGLAPRSSRGSPLVPSPSRSAAVMATGGAHPPTGSPAQLATSHLPGPVTNAYPLSAVIMVAVVAFLFGSLLRSLLSPADYVYAGEDVPPLVPGGDATGWRELRRLVEIKYLVGGWDFQIALVRRR